MAYSKQTWADGETGGTPLSAARLNPIEAGIETVSLIADTNATNIATLQAPPSCRVYSPGFNNDTSSAWKAVKFTGQSWDSSNFWPETGTDTEKTQITVPTAGIYDLYAFCKWPAGAGVARSLRLLSVSGTWGSGELRMAQVGNTAASVIALNLAMLLNFAQGDKLSIQVWQDTGAAQTCDVVFEMLWRRNLPT